MHVQKRAFPFTVQRASFGSLSLSLLRHPLSLSFPLADTSFPFPLAHSVLSLPSLLLSPPPSFSPPLPPSLPPLPPPTGPPHPLTHTSTSQAKKAQEEALSIEKVLLQVLSSPPHPRTLTPARARTSARRARASADTLYGSVRKCVKE